MTNNDKKWMSLAVSEAMRCKGNTSKNPPVGCVIVNGDTLISYASTSPSGRPHAEENALKKLKDKSVLKNAKMYVTLEPCAHINTLGYSCADLIAKSGISEVFICCVDPDIRTNLKGVNHLKKNKIRVHVNFMEKEAFHIYEGFFSRLKQNKPFVTLKIACSLDGKIALKNNESKWITNNLSRNFSHLLRAQSDAILTSSKTIMTDNSLLTCRLDGMKNRSPSVVILDRYLKLNSNYKVFKNGVANFYIYSLFEDKNYLDDINNIIRIKVNSDLSNIDFFNFIFEDLATKGINNLMIEVGGKLNTILLSSNLVDKLIIFRSSKIIGNDGLPFINDLNKTDINKLNKFKISNLRSLDGDILEIYNNYEA